MKKLGILLMAIFIVCSALALPRSYEKNSHVSYKVDSVKGRYKITYTYRDQYNKTQTFHYSFDKGKVRKMNARFGAPDSLSGKISFHGEGRTTAEAEKDVNRKMIKYEKQSESILARGFLVKEYGEINLNYDEFIEYYSPVFCKPIAEHIKETAVDDTRLEYIERAMKFVQDIPYGIPGEDKDGVMRVGIFTPARILVNGYGDCDSKTALFLGIIRYLISDSKAAVFSGNGHSVPMLKSNQLAVPAFEHNGCRWSIAEVAGTGRVPFGYTDRLSGQIIDVELRR